MQDISTATGQSAMSFTLDVYDPQWLHSNVFGDPLTIPLASPCTVQNFHMERDKCNVAGKCTEHIGYTKELTHLDFNDLIVFPGQSLDFFLTQHF